MKTIASLAVAACLFTGGLLVAAEKGDPTADLKTLVGKVNGKIGQGKKTEKDLQAELKEFDALLEKYKDDKSDSVAQIAFMKALLYIQVFDETEKGVALVKEIKAKFPNSPQGQKADDTIAMIEKQAAGKAIQKSLVEGSAFPDFDEKDTAGKPLSVAGYKGKVVLVDFWATWCGPCVAELPHVKETYEKHHGKGFEIIGISLDSDESKLSAFVKKEGMTWAQYFDGKGWQNKLATKYGVNSIPATYLIGADGKIIAKNLRGAALEEAVAKALKK